MKKVLMLLVCLLLLGCESNNLENDKKDETSNTTSSQTVNEENGILKFKKEYEELNENSVPLTVDTNVNLVYLDVNEAVDFVKNKTGIIYFGFPGCPWCRNIVPVLFSMVDDIYYFNPRTADDAEKFNELISLLSDYLQEDNGEKLLYVPDVYFIKNGKIVGHHLGSATSQTNPYTPLTDEQKLELKNIYQNLINKLKEN